MEFLPILCPRAAFRLPVLYLARGGVSSAVSKERRGSLRIQGCGHGVWSPVSFTWIWGGGGISPAPKKRGVRSPVYPGRMWSLIYPGRVWFLLHPGYESGLSCIQGEVWSLLSREGYGLYCMWGGVSCI